MTSIAVYVEGWSGMLAKELQNEAVRKLFVSIVAACLMIVIQDAIARFQAKRLGSGTPPPGTFFPGVEFILAGVGIEISYFGEYVLELLSPDRVLGGSAGKVCGAHHDLWLLTFAAGITFAVLSQLLVVAEPQSWEEWRDSAKIDLRSGEGRSNPPLLVRLERLSSHPFWSSLTGVIVLIVVTGLLS